MPAPRKTSSNTAVTALMLLSPPLLYPVFYLVCLIQDTVLGDRLIIDHLRYVARRDLLELFLRDWAAALPVSYLVAVPVLGLAVLIVRRGIAGVCTSLAVPSLAVAAMLSATVLDINALPVLATSAAVFILLPCWVLSRC